jgi:transcriptional regulator with XRE-family HTH domain
VPEQEDKMLMMPAIDMVATGRNIAKMRQNAGLTVKDLQIFFGFATPQAIYKWQHGTAMPTIDNLVALAMIFGVTMDEIIVVDTDIRAKISA